MCGLSRKSTEEIRSWAGDGWKNEWRAHLENRVASLFQVRPTSEQLKKGMAGLNDAWEVKKKKKKAAPWMTETLLISCKENRSTAQVLKGRNCYQNMGEAQL